MKISFELKQTAIEWIVVLQRELGMHHETIDLSVDLFNRYVGISCIMRLKDTKLVAAACMLIASKYHEIDEIPIGNICAYGGIPFAKKRAILYFERDILKTVCYNLKTPQVSLYCGQYSDSVQDKHFAFMLSRYYSSYDKKTISQALLKKINPIRSAQKQNYKLKACCFDIEHAWVKYRNRIKVYTSNKTTDFY